MSSSINGDISIRILGAYGTKSKNCGTSSFELNPFNMIDAGNLLNPLEEKSANIENIWLTHSHLDHISDIAYILDNYFMLRTKTLYIYGLPQTIATLKKHFFNDLVWPDFAKIDLPNLKGRVINYVEVELGRVYSIDNQESIEAFKTDHTVASCGYIYKKNNHGVIITSDTYSLKEFIKCVNSDREIKSMVIECSFPLDMHDLAKESKHLTAKLLFNELKNLKRDDIQLYINHIKPIYLEIITKEIEEYKGKYNPIILKDGDIVKF